MRGIGGLSAAERVLAGVAGCLLLAGVVSTTTVNAESDAHESPVVTTTVQETALPVVPSPAPKPSKAPRPGPRSVAADRALAAAPPLTGCPPRHHGGGGGGTKPLPPPEVAEASLPAPVPLRPKASDLSAVGGKGLWATPFGKARLDVDGLVAKARATHVRSIWVRTGGSRQGYYGNQFLADLTTKAHAHGIRVIAWDFPFLSDPVADAHRAQLALAAGIDGFSPDVETAAEGTRLTSRRLRLYLSLVRMYAGERPVVATVPRPSSARATFPYRVFPAYADVFAPMVYWSCKEPGALVQDSLRKLRVMLPVAPIGQGYDMGEEGGRRGTPSRLETLRFLDAARRGGALGASLWTVEEAGPQQLRALADYRW